MNNKTILLFGDVHCVPMDTSEVLTKKGWTFLRDLNDEEIMISDINGNLKFGKQTKIIKPYTEEVISISNRSNFKFESTKEHRNMVINRSGDNIIKTTEELLNISNIQYITAGNIKQKKEQSQLELDLNYLAGFMLGDGTFDDPWKISVKKHRKIELLSKYLEYLTFCPQKNNYVVFRLKAQYNSFINNLFDSKKKLNWKNILNLDLNSMKSFLTGYIDSDGCRRIDGRKTISITSIHNEHIKLYQTLNVLTGNSCIEGKTQDNINSTFPSNKPLYVGNARPRNYTYVSKKTRNISTRVTEVGCVNVETGLFMIRQNNQVLITGNCPYQHQNYFDFLEAVRKKYRPTRVVCMGDLVDNHAISYHESNPDLLSPGDELEQSIEYISWLTNIFPKMEILNGNHDKLPIRKAKTAGLPSRFIKNNHEVFNMPKDWTWHNELYIDMPKYGKLWLRHYFTTDIIGMAQQYNVCMAQGHLHARSNMDWVMNKSTNVWALTVGCGVDDKSLAMEYNKFDKHRPIHSVVIIKDGIPEFVYMELDKHNMWTGNLI